MDLRVELGRLTLSNPILVASGTFGYAREAAGFVDQLGADYIFPTLPTAVAAYAEWYRDTHGAPPPGLRIPPPPAPPHVT